MDGFALIGCIAVGYLLRVAHERLHRRKIGREAADLRVDVENALWGPERPATPRTSPQQARLLQVVSDAEVLVQRACSRQATSRRVLMATGMSDQRWRSARRYLQQCGVVDEAGIFIVTHYGEARRRIRHRCNELSALVRSTYTTPM
jgi:hypothetical protein